MLKVNSFMNIVGHWQAWYVVNHVPDNRAAHELTCHPS